MIAYLFDDDLRRQSNREGRMFWEAYLEEICTQLGVPPTPVPPAALDREGALASVDGLMVGVQSGGRLSAAALQGIDRWVREGGTLVGFAVEGLDEVFGVRGEGSLPSPEDYAIGGYCEFALHPLTREIHPFLDIDHRLPLLSPVRLLSAADAVQLARLYDAEERRLDGPAITWRAHGAGFAGYFAFDVPRTVWSLHQGRPLPAIPDGQYALRTPQLQALGRCSLRIPYADEIVQLLQNMMAGRWQPFVSPVPPDRGRVADAVLYYSGDEYTGPAELSLQASDFMAAQGLPYHINIAAERHPMTGTELQHILDNGHEVSCYMWIHTEERGSLLTEERLRAQSDRLLARFGFRPGSVLIGSTQWRGWSEPARWLAAAGATADNTFVGSRLYDHPLLNGPFYGFGFGTACPFFFYDDPAHGNARIDLVEQPIVGYELGHRGSLTDESTHQRELETRSPEDVHEPIDRAVRYHQVINLFYHPYYIVHCPYCREAIQEIRRYIAYRGYRVLHLANNQVAAWWRARAGARVERVAVEADRVRLAGRCDWPDGMVARVRLDGRRPIGASAAGRPAPFEVRREFGGDWLYLVLPVGEHTVDVTLVPASEPDGRG